LDVRSALAPLSYTDAKSSVALLIHINAAHSNRCPKKGEEQKGGNDGDDCAREKQKKHSENLRKAPQQIESHEYTVLHN
jgi:hypothetical protein